MIRQISETRSPIKIWASDLETQAEQQLRNLAELPFIFSHVAVMPDAHAGRGSTVGTVIATRGAIIPAAVGVDIGCGMCAVRTPFKIEDLGGDKRLRELRHQIERAIPTGHFSNKNFSNSVAEAFYGLGPLSEAAQENLKRESLNNAIYQIGSLGGGNHFIEICTDVGGQVWVMLHSGSRNIGKILADLHIGKAKGLMKEQAIRLPDPDLSYLVQDQPEFKDYVHDLMWAQSYARANRNEMMTRVLKEVSDHVRGRGHYPGADALTLQRVDCHHNYTALETHQGREVYVTRKGALSAREGEWGIIPGSMGAKSFIVRGKGASDSFCSCSHGAGRRMSRTAAKAKFSATDLIEQTRGIECRKDKDVVDEIPAAYKDIDEVMQNQADLVEPVYELRQIICVKGA